MSHLLGVRHAEILQSHSLVAQAASDRPRLLKLLPGKDGLSKARGSRQTFLGVTWKWPLKEPVFRAVQFLRLEFRNEKCPIRRAKSPTQS